MKRWRRRLLWLAAIVAVLAGIGAWQEDQRARAEPYDGDPHELRMTLGTGQTFELEVTQNPRRGLRGRALGKGQGMIFLHPEQPARFTMAGVKRWLALLSVGRDGTVVGRQTMRPCRQSSWRRCPIYSAPSSSVLSIETRPRDISAIELGQPIISPAGVQVLVR